MKNKKIALDLCLAQLEAEIENFVESISFNDTIRMNFLEQSAKYLGVYVEGDSTELPDDRKVN